MTPRWTKAWRRAMVAAIGDDVAEERLLELRGLVCALDDPEVAAVVARHLDRGALGRALQRARDEYRRRVPAGAL